jgi:hypothetical protein
LAATLPPLEAVEDLDAARLLADPQPAAMAARVTGRAAGLSMRNIDLEVFDGQTIHAGPARAGRGRTHQSPAFLGGPMQSRAGDVTAVGIEFSGRFQAALGLRF